MKQSERVQAGLTVEAALEACLEWEQLAHARFASAVDAEINDPFRACVRSAAAAHRRRLDALRSVMAQAQDRAAAVPDAVLAYRRATVDEVFRPLLELLERVDCGGTISRLTATLADELAGGVSQRPERLRRPEPPALYLRKPGDSWHLVLRKALTRGTRKTGETLITLSNRLRRLAGREARPLPDRLQLVPLGQLVAWHVAVRLPQVRAHGVRDVQSGVGSRVASLEAATSQWIHALIALESTLEEGATTEAVSEETGDADVADFPDEAKETGESREAAIMDATQLAEQLQTSLDAATVPLAVPDFAALLAGSQEALRTDVERVGSFMLREDRRAVPAQPVRAARDMERTNAEWTTWHRQAAARLTLDIATADFRDFLIQRREDLGQALEAEAARPIDRWLTDTAGALRELRVSVEESCTGARQASDAAALAAELRAVEERAVGILRHESSLPLALTEIEQVTRTAADAFVDGVLDVINAFDEAVTVHERPLAGLSIQPATRPVRIRVREMAEQAFDAVLLERIRTSTRPADEVFAKCADLTDELVEVIRFNLRAAQDEIAADGPDGARLDGAEELALNGLDRSVSALLAVREEVWHGVRRADFAARKASRSGWDRFHDRVMVEDRVQDQLLDFRYRIRSALREAARQARSTAGQLLGKVVARARTGRDHFLRLLRLGRAAVEGERASLEERRATVEALSTLGTVVAGLPLVYRRLFSLQPVEDPALLVGRDADLEAVRQHFAHWQMGVTDALLITGGRGSGRTSLLKVVRDGLLADADVHAVELRDRCLEEAGFVKLLEPAFPVEAGQITTFSELAELLQAAPPPDRPRVIIIEELEYTLLRTAAGNGLLGRVFSLMSATDAHVFWLTTMGRSAWDYIERTEPLSPGLVRHYPLSPLHREQLEQVMKRRHMRSGLPIRFLTPSAPGPGLSRRLRRAGSEASRQEILQSDFFDRLSRASGQDITLALFYWLRSATVDRDAGTLNVRPFEPLNFGHFEELSLHQCFGLKALLDHGSLTLDEYCRIFGAARAEAHALFESLGNQLLIESAESDNVITDFRFCTIADGDRYRIRPLVAQSVTRHLRARNLLLEAP